MKSIRFLKYFGMILTRIKDNILQFMNVYSIYSTAISTRRSYPIEYYSIERLSHEHHIFPNLFDKEGHYSSITWVHKNFVHLFKIMLMKYTNTQQIYSKLFRRSTQEFYEFIQTYEEKIHNWKYLKLYIFCVENWFCTYSSTNFVNNCW